MDWRTNVLGKLDSPQMNLLNKAEAVQLLKDAYWTAGDALIAATVANTSNIVTTTLQAYLVAHVGNQDARGAVFVDYQNSLNRPKNVIIVTEVNLDNYKNMLLEDLI